MADTSVVHIGENSPEQVAYKLMREIGLSQGYFTVHKSQKPSPEWIIRTYSACLHAVRAPGYPQDALSLLPEMNG